MPYFFIIWVSSSALNKNDSGNTDLSFYVYVLKIFRVLNYHVLQATFYRMVIFLMDVNTRGGVESKQTNFELILLEFFKLKMDFWINQRYFTKHAVMYSLSCFMRIFFNVDFGTMPMLATLMFVVTTFLSSLLLGLSHISRILGLSYVTGGIMIGLSEFRRIMEFNYKRLFSAMNQISLAMNQRKIILIL